MAAAENSGPVPDLYWLLGVSRGASGGEIAQAWRRRAREEHPDLRPRDAVAPARFRALAEAYRVLGDPARRAAYDQSLRDHGADASASQAPDAAGGRLRPGAGGPTTAPSARPVPEPPLRAGPVWVQVPRAAEEEMVRMAVLAELTVRYLADDWGWPW